MLQMESVQLMTQLSCVVVVYGGSELGSLLLL